MWERTRTAFLSDPELHHLIFSSPHPIQDSWLFSDVLFTVLHYLTDHIQLQITQDSEGLNTTIFLIGGVLPVYATSDTNKIWQATNYFIYKFLLYMFMLCLCIFSLYKKREKL